MEIKTVKLENPNDLNLILGQSHFIKTVEDIHEAMVWQNSGWRFAKLLKNASYDTAAPMTTW
jgi:adenosine/AMP kinase